MRVVVPMVTAFAVMRTKIFRVAKLGVSWRMHPKSV